MSVTPGEECGLYVSTTASSFRVSAFRVGWYGGTQARLVWSSERIRGRVQPEPRFLPATRTVRAEWRRTLTFGTAGWPEGAYLLRLDADGGHQRYIPLIVRSTQGTGRTVLIHAPATWQAYNRWGGYSLYAGASGAYATRSLAVSFDRPYDSDGAEKFTVYERAAVVLAERLGIPLAYTTGIDVHRDPQVLHGAATVVCLGHDEYWTPEQRRHVTQARDAGTNVVFLGANTCFRRVRIEQGQTQPDRTVVCYKSSATADPCYTTQPALVTTRPRRRIPSPRSRGCSTRAIRRTRRTSSTRRTTGCTKERAYGPATASTTTGSHLRPPSPSRWRSRPILPSCAVAAAPTATRPTTRLPAARACSPPAPCAGWRPSWPAPPTAAATTEWTRVPAPS
nr:MULTISPECIES: N,N-dimethylformamidase beta subunit family domain-containing protein [Streptomyces]